MGGGLTMLRCVFEVMPDDAETAHAELFETIQQSTKGLPAVEWLNYDSEPIAFGLEALLAACKIDGESGSEGDICDEILEGIRQLESVQSSRLRGTGVYHEAGMGPQPRQLQEWCSWDVNHHDWENFEPVFRYQLDDGRSITVEQEAPSLATVQKDDEDEESAPTWTGALVWTAAIAMGKYLECAVARGDISQGCTMVELGAGTGLVGIVGAAMGAKVTLTDLTHVLPRLEKNVHARSPMAEKNVTVAPLHWGETNVAPFLPCDYILACEVIYSEEAVPMLVKALRELCQPESVVLLGYDLRGRVGIMEFFEATVLEWVVEEVAAEELHPSYRSPDVVLLRMRLRPFTEAAGGGMYDAFQSEHRINKSMGLVVKHDGKQASKLVCQTVPIQTLSDHHL